MKKGIKTNITTYSLLLGHYGDEIGPPLIILLQNILIGYLHCFELPMTLYQFFLASYVYM